MGGGEHVFRHDPAASAHILFTAEANKLEDGNVMIYDGFPSSLGLNVGGSCFFKLIRFYLRSVIRSLSIRAARLSIVAHVMVHLLYGSFQKSGAPI